MSRKAEKRKLQKQKKREKIALKLAIEKLKFDIVFLLKLNSLDTKPKLGDFLKEYIKDITIFNQRKILLYPELKYDIAKVFVKFLDGHEVIWIKDRHPEEFYLYYLTEEVNLSKTLLDLVIEFFLNLVKFKFVY